jgi:hypothetical protein
VTTANRDLIDDQLSRLLGDFLRLSDMELRAVRLIWESEDKDARADAYGKALATIKVKGRMPLVEDAQSTLRKWMGNYLSATTAEYGAFLTGPNSGLDAGEVRRGAIPPIMDAVVAIVGVDGLLAEERELLLAPVTEVTTQHGRERA